MKSLGVKKNLDHLDPHKIKKDADGQKTRERLKRKGIESPSISGMVLVKGNTRMVPKVKLKTEKDLENWRNEMIEKFNL